MTFLGDTIRTVILANAAVAALVGTRMYPDALAQASPDVAGNFPAISYQKISEVRQGALSISDPLPGVLFQVDSWDVTRTGAETLARLVRIAFDNYRGAPITVAVLENSRDDFQPDVKLYREIQEYRVWWVEA